MGTTERLAALLHDRGAEGIPHPGGTLSASMVPPTITA